MSLPNPESSQYDSMSTEELEEILRRDALLADGGGYDVDTILHIMEIITEREKDQIPEKYADVDAAWASFNKHYRPLVGSGPLCDFDGDAKE